MFGLNFIPRAFLVSAFVLFGMATQSFAGGEVIAKALVEGKVVYLYADKTWAYDTAGDANSTCEQLSNRISFCPQSGEFEQLPKQSPDQLAMFRKDERNYAAIVAEELGTSSGNSVEFMRAAILENLALAGVNKHEATLADHTKLEFAGQPSERLTYIVNINGLDITFTYTLTVTKSYSTQFVTWAVTNQFSDALIQTHNDFLSLFKVDHSE